MSSSYDNITRLNLFSVRVNQSEKKKRLLFGKGPREEETMVILVEKKVRS